MHSSRGLYIRGLCIRGLYINGCWKKGRGQLFSSQNPANQLTLWEECGANEIDVEEAVKAAQKALGPWQLLSVAERLNFLKKFTAQLADHLLTIAETISKEVGKPLWESKAEVTAMIQKLDLSYQAQQKRCETTTQTHPLGQLVTQHRPHGVVAVFGPFNFPGHLPNGHIIPALLAGNTVIFKPSEYAPAVAEIVMSCWDNAGLPAGVINLLQGGRETGQWLAQHAEIDGLFFTGSFATGQKFMDYFAHHPGKILALELGGNNPLVVSTVSNLPAAVQLIIQSAYLTSGQRCTCARRLIVLKSMAPDLIFLLKEKIAKIRINSYDTSPEPFMGPVINAETAQFFLNFQQQLIEGGAIPIVLMQSLNPTTGFLTPGLIDVTHCHTVSDTEIFGPLLQIIQVATFAEAIKEANRTRYGLAAGLLADSSEEFQVFKNQVKAGIINWNVPLTGASSAAPFGGVGASGNHRPSAYYAADYCNYPVSSIESVELHTPSSLPPGLEA